MKMNQTQMDRMHTGKGFIAALDQSGGSTPKTLKLYGIDETAYSNNDEIFELIHAMRTRIMTSPAFTSEFIIGAILFDNTLDKRVCGVPTTEYLLNKGILPFLKVDLGLADMIGGVQMMKPIANLDARLEKAVTNNVFGTKMRSVIKGANRQGIHNVVSQQFYIAMKIMEYGLVPIIEPEVDINISDKEAAEAILKDELVQGLSALAPKQKVIFKLTLPTQDGFYSDLLADNNLVRIISLSGGYSQSRANEKLAKNPGVIASFSRALTEGLSVSQTDEEFNKTLGSSIQAIAAASNKTA